MNTFTIQFRNIQLTNPDESTYWTYALVFQKEGIDPIVINLNKNQTDALQEMKIPQITIPAF